jgi:2-dehydro-3-deoxyphosphogluconate aldolase/(4S)-4-hydroxy-2-oxoglutarate aldolase
MSEMNPVVQRLGEIGLVVVIRTDRVDDNFVRAVDAMVEGGAKAVEITFTVPDAVSVIRRMNDEFAGSVLLGAGTVLNPSDAVAAVNAGAKYIVSPATNIEVIGIAKRLGVAVIPGAFTPTEVLAAWSAGADIVKIFPASVGGPAYIKALKGPLPHVPMLPTGGVELDNVGEFFAAGAFAVAVGGNLFKKDLVKAGDFDGLRKLAAAFVAEGKKARR